MFFFILSSFLFISSIYSSHQEQKNATEQLFELLKRTTPASIQEIESLVGAGADVNAQDDQGNTPLHLAAQKNFLGVCQCLLKNGAKIYEKNGKGEMPLSLAQDEKLKGVLTWTINLLKLRYYEDEKDLVQEIEDCLKNGAILQATGFVGKTALHFAAVHGCAEVVEKLMENGSQINVRDEYGNTPLHLAAHCGHAKIVEKLIEKGPQINVRDKYGNTPLHLAAVCGHEKVVEKLIKNGYQIDALNNGGYTPLHVAASSARKRSLQIIKALLEHGAKINKQNNEGDTPLHWAVRSTAKESLQKVRLLLEHEAEINKQNNGGDTPLHWAANLEKKEVIKYLLKRGAGDQIKNKKQEKPVDLLKKESTCKELFDDKLIDPWGDGFFLSDLFGEEQNDGSSAPPKSFPTVQGSAISKGMKVGGVCLVVASLIYGQYESKGISQKEQMQKQNRIKRALTFLKKKKISVALGSVGVALLGTSFFVK